MSDGSEWRYFDSKGPRKGLHLRIAPEVYLLLKVAAGADGAAYGMAIAVLEQWAEDYLKRNADALDAAVAERRTREAATVQRPPSSGRSVQKRGE